MAVPAGRASGQRFTGLSILVTGAAGEIGSAVAGALVAEGARVTLADLDATVLTQLADELGSAAHAVPTDVTVEEDVERAVAEAVAFAGGLHGVFNNAGIEGPVGPITELDLDRFAQVLRINVLGAAAVLKHSLPRLDAGGAVVQTGSTASVAGSAHMAPYVASKHALLGLTRVASREVAARGVRVTAVLPGPVHGRMMQRIESGRSGSGTATATTPTALDGGRYATVAEVVSAVLFLLSGEAGFVAGTGLLMDGGRLA
ncbi:NAD(P)-dependent dehydrogenase, short-chain alcohol dehydrogenase family [Geodermatophilus africanus]|uniref:NAD(P)-dependent dehydrogenase, short-chain alcohol dehydrogenase family n=1 Tax=Geodermatophilus africanus TaxID=1137993 RepID=A0A1H3PLS2_9ACTN|nr:SDR family oxidoreductase [Geodermatophilus africanus]SDZ01429.1 NAD(P)-dependent dehydrogenase, short-chain alcohol dehydrogenase family [Geodermatophilus africanus]